jgi:hypothetical protein
LNKRDRIKRARKAGQASTPAKAAAARENASVSTPAKAAAARANGRKRKMHPDVERIMRERDCSKQWAHVLWQRGLNT